MRSAHVAAALFGCLMAVALILDSVTLRQPELLDALGLKFDLPIHLSLSWSLAIAVVCGSVHALSSSRASDGVALVALLLILHTIAYTVNALDPSKPGRRRMITFATRHGAATLGALALAFVLKMARTLYKLTRWRCLLKRVEQETEAGAAASANSRGDGPVLLLYANVGSGHKRAAEAIRAALLNRGTDPSKVVMLDAMELAPSGFRYVMQVCFQELTQSLAGQHVLGYLYDAADHGRAKVRFQRVLEDLCLLGMVEKVSELRPSVIICTHFLPAQLFAGIRKRSAVLTRQIPLAVVLTDLDLQYLWVHTVDHYFVPREDAARVLRAYQKKTALLDKTGISVCGIPILPAFVEAAKQAERVDAQETRVACLAKFGLEAPSKDGRPVVVLLSSGKQLVVATFAELMGCETALRVLIVMGRQADARAELEMIPVPERHSRWVLGFVDDMPSLYRCADLLVSKSGGLTIAEAAALGVPMVVLDPIPGQEQRNADVLLQVHAAIKINDLPLLATRVDEIFTGGKRDEMAAAMRTLGKPNAAFDIADAVIQKQLQPIAKHKLQ